MDALHLAYDHYSLAFWLVTTALLVVVGAMAVAGQRRSRRVEDRLESIFRDTAGGNTPQLLAEYLGTVRNAASTVERMRQQHESIVDVMPSVIRHVGLVRFSPFRDTGGDQSFALALLDGKADGVVVTALHSRKDSRLYAKPIDHGTSEYSLTPEEHEAIDLALARRGDPVHA